MIFIEGNLVSTVQRARKPLKNFKRRMHFELLLHQPLQNPRILATGKKIGEVLMSEERWSGELGGGASTSIPS